MHERLTGDALAILPTLRPATFDIVLTDPPYAMPAAYYEGRKVTRRWSDSSILTAWWRLVLAAVAPTLKPNAMLCVFANATAVAAFYPAMYELTRWLQVAVWDKGIIGMGGAMRLQTEFVLVGAVGKPYGRSRSFGNVLRHRPVHHSNRVHQAQKPSGLILELLRQFCPRDGRVLDCFAGSHVVGETATGLGLDCTSIEWDES